MNIIDTNILMGTSNFKNFAETFPNITIPLEVLKELDKLKNTVGDTGYQARRAIRGIESIQDYLNFLVPEQELKMPVDDVLIHYCKNNVEATLVTNDLAMALKANSQQVKTANYVENITLPNCYLEFDLEEHKELPSTAFESLPIGQYLILKDRRTGKQVKALKKLGEDNFEIIDTNKKIGNRFETISPKDIHQSCAIDSLYNDSVTAIVGAAGTGKTLLSFAYCLQKIGEGHRVHIFVNPVKTRGAEELGFYSGNRDGKLLQNFIGDILNNKIGDSQEVMNMIQSEQIKIYPFSDIRGVEVPAGDVMYITEAQNLNIDLLKLALQRCAEGSKIIVEGDPFAQVDKNFFSNENNGLKRMINVFSGECGFSYIYLPNIYRSKIAELAERM